MSKVPLSSANADTAEPRGKPGASVYFPVILILGVGLLATAFTVLWSVRASETEAQLRFEHRCERLVTEIQRRVRLTGHGLMGARDLYMGSTNVSRLDFRDYAESRDFSREFPGAIGFGVVERVLRENLEAFVAAERADHAPHYDVVDAGSHADLYLVKYIEPLEQNRGALGYDIGSEPIRRAAVEKAIRTGEHILTSPIQLVQDSSARAGFLYLVPLYKKDSLTTSPETRLENLLGLVVAPITIGTVLADWEEITVGMMQFAIYDGAVETESKPFFRSNESRTGHEESAGRNFLSDGTFQASGICVIADRSWTVHAWSTPKFEVTIDRYTALRAAVIGATLTLLLSILVGALAKFRAQSIALTHHHALALARESDNATLERLLSERSHELEATQRELLKKERMAVLGELISTVSHELRTPLGTIQASIYTVKKRSENADLDLEAPIERAVRNIHRCDRIIEELLDYTRSRPMERTMTEVDSWVHDALGDFPFPEGVKVEGDFQSGVEISIDQSNLRRCLVNALQNACDAMVGIDIKAQKPEGASITVTTRSDSNRLVIAVRDNGCGISISNMERIFEPLFTTKSLGIGLGLPIVTEILAFHGGGMEIQSDEGIGTTVSMWLPLHAEAP